VVGSILDGGSRSYPRVDPRSGQRGTEASPRYDTLLDALRARHIPERITREARKRACVQSLPERFPRPLPPWDVSFSGSFFMRCMEELTTKHTKVTKRRTGECKRSRRWLSPLSLAYNLLLNALMQRDEQSIYLNEFFRVFRVSRG